MTDLPSRNSLEKTTDTTPSVADDASRPIDAVGQALFERLGVGGMGEVYRCGDDALQRDLAIKILKLDFQGDAAAEARFLREARLTGSLQHPGIVPVHQLGSLADGRPFYTMKLVRGRTMSDLLRDEPQGPERLPRLLAVLEKVCQAVAFAHSKGVIHRDLKPSNVMVGEFGEVQVMDWGLAKELSQTEPVAVNEETAAVETVARTEEAEGLSRAGLALGTPAYMPPEQAAGDWDIVDERADVFALGAILCQVLTSLPPYHGTSRDELLRRARRGDLVEALGRLEKCGADAALVELCRVCLAAERLQRPRHAGVVAERLASYQAEVRERLRRAELERARAEVKALEERKRRQLLAVLALMALVLLASAGSGLWWRQLKQDRADRAALTALERGRQRLDEGWRLHDLTMLREAKAEAERAADIGRGGVSDAVEQQVAYFHTAATERLARAEKNRDLLNALVDIATPHETKTYKAAEPNGKKLTLPEPSVEEQYAAAFRRRWPDVDVENQVESVVAARLQEEPEVVLQAVIAGLDGWMLEQRRQKRDETKWRRLLGLVERLDHSEQRRQLRALQIGAVPPRAEDVVGLVGGCPPWVALWQLGRGKDWRHLRQLRGRMDAVSEPVLTVLLLAQASSEVGDEAGAEAVLRLALARRPDEVALLDALGNLLARQDRPRLDEAIGCYRAARAKHPGLGLTLSQTLIVAGQEAEGQAILRDLVRQQPKNPELFLHLGKNLADGQQKEAEAAYRKAIELNPDYAEAYISLGLLLSVQGKRREAEAVYCKLIALQPDNAEAYYHLGTDLSIQRKYAEAEAVYRKAIALKPDNPWGYDHLGRVLNAQTKYAEAEAAYRKAIALQPDNVWAYNTLGSFLSAQRRYAEAEAAYRKFIALKPDAAWAYSGLGGARNNQKKYAEAEAAYRKAIEIQPDIDTRYHFLGDFLSGQGKYAEAEVAYRKAIAIQPDAAAYSRLGGALNNQKKYAEAEVAYRKAIAIQPDWAVGYFSLGICLIGQRKYVDAEAAYRKAIEIHPHYAEAHCNLGSVLQLCGRFRESLTVYRRGHELGSKQSDWRYPSLQWVRTAERFDELEDKFPGVLQGEIAPSNAGESITLAWMCWQPYKKRYAASARLYADAFALDPKLADDLIQHHRYYAACSAVLAATKQNKDTRLLPDKVTAMFRRWALGWLRDHLAAEATLAERKSPDENRTIQQRLAHWRIDPDLASVHDPQALNRLPDNERAAWQALWRDVDELVKRVTEKKP